MIDQSISKDIIIGKLIGMNKKSKYQFLLYITR
jgi:hypothetical protein